MIFVSGGALVMMVSCDRWKKPKPTGPVPILHPLGDSLEACLARYGHRAVVMLVHAKW